MFYLVWVFGLWYNDRSYKDKAEWGWTEITTPESLPQTLGIPHLESFTSIHFDLQKVRGSIFEVFWHPGNLTHTYLWGCNFGYYHHLPHPLFWYLFLATYLINFSLNLKKKREFSKILSLNPLKSVCVYVRTQCCLAVRYSVDQIMQFMN